MKHINILTHPRFTYYILFSIPTCYSTILSTYNYSFVSLSGKQSSSKRPNDVDVLVSMFHFSWVGQNGYCFYWSVHFLNMSATRERDMKAFSHFDDLHINLYSSVSLGWSISFAVSASYAICKDNITFNINASRRFRKTQKNSHINHITLSLSRVS